MNTLKEMNFFNEFLQAKAKAAANRVKAMIAIAVYFGVMIVVFLFFWGQNISAKDERDFLDMELANPVFQQAQEEIDLLTGRINALTNYLLVLAEMDYRLETLHKVTAEENYEVFAAFPDGVLVRQLSISERNFELQAYALELDLVPAVVENLWQTELFETIYPPNTAWTGIGFEEYQENENDNPLYDLINDNFTIYDEVGYYTITINGVFAEKEVY